MSRRNTGVGRRTTRRQSRWSRSAIIWSAVAIAGVALAVVATRPARAAHPTPRQMDHTDHVVAHEHYGAYPRVAEVYRQAAAVPHVLDGIYCYCSCSEHSGHYSLLDCFASDHGARCDVCLSEASIAWRMTRDGASLEQIRDAIDELYGG